LLKYFSKNKLLQKIIWT